MFVKINCFNKFNIFNNNTHRRITRIENIKLSLNVNILLSIYLFDKNIIKLLLTKKYNVFSPNIYILFDSLYFSVTLIDNK